MIHIRPGIYVRRGVQYLGKAREIAAIYDARNADEATQKLLAGPGVFVAKGMVNSPVARRLAEEYERKNPHGPT